MSTLYIHHANYLDDYALLVSFSNGEKKIVDLSELISNNPNYSKLQNITVFQSFDYDDFTITRCDGTIDIAPEYLYTHGKKIGDILRLQAVKELRTKN